jgi:PAS domain S-box-containing protein
LPEGKPDDGSELPTDPDNLSASLLTPDQTETGRPRVLVADDNADMRRYVVRLLAGPFTVEDVPDGAAALEAVRRQSPDLILSDVMMPRLDGFGLLQALRSDPHTAGLPVILLSARAGEESRVEGMQAGADDYLVKPFSARELLARVSAHLQMARLRREASESLRASEQRFQSFMNYSPTTAFIKDGEGRYVFVNRTVERQFGRPLAEWIGKTDLDLFPPEEVRLIRRNDLSVLTSRKTAQLEEFLTGPDGPRTYLSFKFPLQDRDGSWLLAGMSIDITEQKRAEQELAEAHQFLHSSLDALSSHIAVLDKDGVILAVNDAWKRFADDNLYTGHNYGVGANYLEACPPNPDECVEAEMLAGLKDVLSGRLPYYEYEYPCHSPTDRRWFVMRVTRFKSPGPVRVVVAHENVTKRRLAEEGLREANRRKDEFLATLAHELRNPLAPIRNSLQILKMPRLEAAIADRAREMMERQVHHLVRLVDDLLDVSRVMQGKVELRKELVELASVVARAVETAQSLIEVQGHELTIHLPDECLLLEADPVRLTQVVGNLLTNAAKYTEPGGRILLTARREGDKAVLRVQDTGIGIPTDMLSKVFDLFVQVDHATTKAQGGLGIGLTLVKNLIEMHQGKVEARSAGLGKGSEFEVWLPLSTRGLKEKDTKEHHEQRASARPTGHRLLVVDDNRDAAESLAMLLRLQGHEVRIVSDGPSALEVAKNYPPELIFLDIGMPGMDGYEVARRLRQQPGLESVRLAALTGWGQPEDRRRSKAAGFDYHLVKPPELKDLDDLLAALKAPGGHKEREWLRLRFFQRGDLIAHNELLPY